MFIHVVRLLYLPRSFSPLEDQLRLASAAISAEVNTPYSGHYSSNS